MCKVSSTVHFVTRSAGGREGSARAHWVPNTDVYTTDNGLVIKVELAGMRSDHPHLRTRVVQAFFCTRAVHRPDF